MVEFSGWTSEFKGVEIISHNPLSAFWNGAFSPDLQVRAQVDKRFLPLLYVAGMGGFALSLPWRICYVVGDIMTMCFRQSGLLIAGGSLGHFISAVIGIACPPVAYKIDDWIQHNWTIYKAHKVETWCFSMWIRNKPDFKNLFTEAAEICVKHQLFDSQTLPGKKLEQCCMVGIFLMLRQDGVLKAFLSGGMRFDINIKKVYDSSMGKEVCLKDAIEVLEDKSHKLTAERFYDLLADDSNNLVEEKYFITLLRRVVEKVLAVSGMDSLERKFFPKPTDGR